MAHQHLTDVVENVGDRWFPADWFADATATIQSLIDTAASHDHLVFPRGPWDEERQEYQPYRIAGALKFHRDNQRVTFLAGAKLELVTSDASVHILGKRQTFTGLWIHVGVSNVYRALPDPCQLIDGADDLLLEDPRVECWTAAVLVRVKDTAGVTIVGGALDGVNELELSTGLELLDGVTEFRAVSLSIHQLGYGVALYGTTQSVSFVNLTMEAELRNMIAVHGHVYGLTLSGVHMESGTANGAYHFIVVHDGGGVHGGSISGCEFGALRNPAATVDAGTPTPGSAAVFWRRVFVIGGEWHGVEVTSCWHSGPDVPVPAVQHSVYEIQATASVKDSGDVFNTWDKVAFADGPGAATLPRLTCDALASTTLVVSAHSIQVNANRIGFFGATPVARSFPYSVGADISRDLVSNEPFRVLGALLRDLASLGLVSVVVRP